MKTGSDAVARLEDLKGPELERLAEKTGAKGQVVRWPGWFHDAVEVVLAKFQVMRPRDRPRDEDMDLVTGEWARILWGARQPERVKTYVAGAVEEIQVPGWERTDEADIYRVADFMTAAGLADWPRPQDFLREWRETVESRRQPVRQALPPAPEPEMTPLEKAAWRARTLEAVGQSPLRGVFEAVLDYEPGQGTARVAQAVKNAEQERRASAAKAEKAEGGEGENHE